MKTESCSIKTLLIWAAMLLLFVKSVQGKGTRVGFYSTSCPEAETIIAKTVAEHLKLNPRIAPGLLRLQFHDCSLRGCDASILIEGPATEKTALQNRGINGYDVINDAKTRLEALCPNVVSCADILALAARDSVVLTGGRKWGWEVPTGRRDGRVSLASETSPKSGDRESVTSQLQLFFSLGLNTQDLVVLVGSHTIGSSSCGLLTRRLYKFTNTTESGADPAINPSFVRTLRAMCPQGGPAANRVELDHGSGSAFDTSYFNNLRRSRGILESDQFLWADPATKPIVARLLNPRGPNGLDFAVEFGKSMVKMSNVGVKTSHTDGEIRRICTAIN